MTASRQATVVRPGLLTTIQDRGRWGYQASGVPVAGPMDLRSHDAANAALGNHPHAATLEITIAGPELRFDDAAIIAVTGADLTATLGGVPVVLGRPHRVPAGAVLSFGLRRRGTRAYLAVNGGIDAPVVLGSRATHAAAGFGRPLVSGDRLPLGPVEADLQVGLSHGEADLQVGHFNDVPAGGARVRVRRGPQTEDVPEAAFDMLASTRFVVGSQSNRMGYRLVGPPVPFTPHRPMISDATFMGALQITPSGEPILLMADRQTTGGYPQIATVKSADLPLVGQLGPGDWIEFEISG